MRRHETRHFRGVLARDIRGSLKVGKEPIGSSKKDLLKVASGRMVITPDKSVLQGWVSAVKLEATGPTEKESRRYYIWIIYGIHSSATRLMRIYRPIYTRLKEEGKVIDSWHIQGGIS